MMIFSSRTATETQEMLHTATKWQLYVMTDNEKFNFTSDFNICKSLKCLFYINHFNTLWTEVCFIYGEKHILSLRLTFCLSQQTQIVYFCIFWSIKAMLSSQCGLQYCRSLQHKKSLFPFLHRRHNSLLKQETTSERWPLHLSIVENNQVCDLKCLWFNLSIKLYICTVSV